MKFPLGYQIQDLTSQQLSPTAQYAQHPPTAQVKMKFLKVGRVAIITHGRYAGKKVRLYTKILEKAYPVAVQFSPRLREKEGRG